MAQPGPSDYSTRHPSVSREDSEGMMDQVSEVGERAATMAGELGLAIKERPYATLAIAIRKWRGFVMSMRKSRRVSRAGLRRVREGRIRRCVDRLKEGLRAGAACARRDGGWGRAGQEWRR